MEIILLVITVLLSILSGLLVLILITIPSQTKARVVFGENPEVADVAKGMMSSEFSDTASDDTIQGFGFEIEDNGEVKLYPHSTVSSHSMQKLLQS